MPFKRSPSACSNTCSNTFLEVMTMPGKARTRAESEIYHAMLRGINWQQIFADEEDHESKAIREPPLIDPRNLAGGTPVEEKPNQCEKNS